MSGTGSSDVTTTIARSGLRERKAWETRRRLLATALDLMAREGPDGVTVGVLAERSDVAVGTFYNYFGTREAIIETIVDIELETMGRRIDKLADGKVADPAEEFTAAVRHIIRMAISDPVWGWLLVRLGPDSPDVLRIVGERLTRSIQRGIHAGRFTSLNVTLASAISLNALLAAIRVFLDADARADRAASTLAAGLLRLLGLPPDEATRLAKGPLVDLPVIADQGAMAINRIPL